MRQIFSILFLVALTSCNGGSSGGTPATNTDISTAGLLFQGSCKYKDGSKLVSCVDLYMNLDQDKNNLESTCESDPPDGITITYSATLKCNQTTRLQLCGLPIQDGGQKAVIEASFYNDYQNYLNFDETCAGLATVLNGTTMDQNL
jgi:hypothetical protein